MKTKTSSVMTPIKSIAESKLNPRKEYDAADLKDLALSMKDTGLVQAVILRPVGKGYEIVAGHRRVKAARSLGWKEIPSEIRTYTDEETVKAMLAENLQRVDLSPIEEGEAYDAMMKNGITEKQISGIIGKSESYVLKRRSLCYLHKDIVKAMKDKKNPLPLGHALLIATLPTDAMQKEALAGSYDSDKTVRSYDRVKSDVVRKMYIPLQVAQFGLTDTTLVPKAGSCVDCPKRSGNKTGLFDDGQDDICTDPSCFREKDEAHWKYIRENSGAKGIIDDVETAELFQYNGPNVGHKKWIVISVPLVTDKKNRTIREIIGEAAVDIYLARDPRTHKIYEFANRKKVMAILIEKGIVKPKELNETGKKELAEKETKKAEKEKKKLEEKILAETKKQFAVEVGKEFVGFKEFDGFDEQSDALRVLAIFTILNAGQFRSVVSRYVKLPEEHDKIYLFLIEYLTTAPIETVVEIWLASVTESIQPNGFTDIRDYLTDTAEEYGVTREDVEREIIDEMDDDE